MVAKRNMQQLAGLLITARKIIENSSASLIDILIPQRFRLLIKATRIIADYDETQKKF